MIAKEQYWFILDEEGRSHVENTDGSVNVTATPTPLVHSPQGWDNFGIAFQRDTKGWGTIRNFSFPLQMVREGAKIIRDIIYKRSVHAKIFLLLSKRTIEFLPGVFKDYHTKYYRGQFDLSKCKDDGADRITVTVGEVGLAKQLKANEATKYEFPLTHPDSVAIRMDGIRLYNAAQFIAPAEAIYDDTIVSHTHTPAFGFNNNEGFAEGAAFFDQIEESAVGADYFLTSPNYCLTVADFALGPIAFAFKGKLFVKGDSSLSGSSLRFEFWKNKTRTGNYADVILNGTNGVTNTGIAAVTGQSTVEIPVDFSITLQPGEKLFFYGVVYGSAPGATGFKYSFLANSEIYATYSNVGATTSIRGFEPAVLGDMILEKITGVRGRFSSELLSGKYAGMVITSGDGLRRIEAAKVKISFNEFFEIFRVIARAAYGIENEILVMEDIKRFFPVDNPIDLGEIAEMNITPAEDLMGNTFKVGHKEKTIDKVNGKYAFNNTHLYSSKNEEVIKEISFVSPAIADPYVIEHTRLNFDGKKTTDGSEDNDLFVIHGERKNIIASSFQVADFFGTFCNLVCTLEESKLIVKGNKITISNSPINNGTYTVDNVYYTGTNLIFYVLETMVAGIMDGATIDTGSLGLVREVYDSLTGVPDNTVFNIKYLTPKRLLDLHMEWINSILWGLSGTYLKFETTEKNADLVTVQGGVTTTEKGDKEVGSEIIWKPFYFETDNMVPVNLVALLEATPYSPFLFQWAGISYKGFLWKAGISPEDDKPQTYRLLCTPDTDQTKLIL